MKRLFMHAHTARLACATALLVALVACASGQPSPQQNNLDLGGGISMTPDGQILGATPAQPSNFAESDYMVDAPVLTAAPAVVPGAARNGAQVK